MKSYLLLISCSLALLLSNCESPKSKPKIPEAQLVSILADIHLAEAALQALRGTTKDSVSQLYYHQIYAIHQVDSATVQAALQEMREQPEGMKDLYDQVMERVEKLNVKTKDAKPQD
ncbi:MAG: DUF4296 domain-containing protein [Phaeodactylibacter sp.]|uniref:DUF4296 domain-containing protein n=1 Tax=Phaeodactylibacter sp. TaxID=1940289 RepID=UPI0032F0220A